MKIKGYEMQLDLNSMMNEMNNTMADAKVFAGDKKIFERDDRFYKISRDSDKNGSVLIRFLPSFNEEKTKLNTFISRGVHNVTRYDANHKKRFINEVCPNSVGGKDCPICAYAWDGYNALKDAGTSHKDGKITPEAKKFLDFTTSTRYITNILVIDDKEKPENNGKIFVFEYGKQIHELIQKSMQPNEDEQKEKGLKPFNAWDLANGRDFRLKLKDGKFTVNGYPSWEESFFVNETRAEASNNDEMMAVLEKAYCLDEFKSLDACLSNEKLQEKLNYVLFKGKTQSVDKSTEKSKVEEMSKPSTMEMPRETKNDDVPFENSVKTGTTEQKTSDNSTDVDSFFAQFS